MSFTTPSKSESTDGRVRHVGDPVGVVGGVDLTVSAGRSAARGWRARSWPTADAV